MYTQHTHILKRDQHSFNSRPHPNTNIDIVITFFYIRVLYTMVNFLYTALILKYFKPTQNQSYPSLRLRKIYVFVDMFYDRKLFYAVDNYNNNNNQTFYLLKKMLQENL